MVPILRQYDMKHIFHNIINESLKPKNKIKNFVWLKFYKKKRNVKIKQRIVNVKTRCSVVSVKHEIFYFVFGLRL